ncbi:hypothetical protein GCM10011519_35010 [Marmoricola endophyticus]|uniref:Cell shape-determining protein MreC n=1 Tax=Marmoricola endophyticus TaxID=2040280 RepID=A0A917BVC7_9ACTN|nr:rod shape-determining protein MreC [Marmoricola endophyticus]GGF58128.1 hypothetical protein GCM10011519_35010 [Marmoricola endophyticus]
MARFSGRRPRSPIFVPARSPRGRRRAPVRLPAVLAAGAVVLMALDAGTGGSPVDPIRAAVGTTVTPVEAAAAGAVRPVRGLFGTVHTNGHLRDDVATLQAQNSELRSRLTTTQMDARRLKDYDGLVDSARTTGYSLVPARVVGIGPAQNFSRTVTLDAGTTSGIRADSTVISRDGLVGRVVRVSATSATVLLLADHGSVVGARLGSTMKIGFVRGRGDLGERGRLDLDLVDDSVRPEAGDTVVSWGSGENGPYVAGIPIGTVESVSSSPRDQSRRAVVEPAVDFSALDLVGVVVPRGTTGDRAVISGRGTKAADADAKRSTR